MILYLDLKALRDWGYEEILDVNEDVLSHEILFSSGSKILIHFSNKMIKIYKQ